MRLEQESALQASESVLALRHPPPGAFTTTAQNDQTVRQFFSADDGALRRITHRTRRCGIVQCRKAHCNLSSHRSYAAVQRYSKQSRQLRKNSTLCIGTPLNGNNELLDHVVGRVKKLLVDSFPMGPPPKIEDMSVFRELAHHYFTDLSDRLIQNFSPQLDRQNYKKLMLDYTLTNDVFCLCITANAKTDMLMRHRLRLPDRSSNTVYSATVRVLQQKTNNFKETEIDWLLLLVVALVGFDLAFDREFSLRGHREALKQLTCIKGGLHAIGHALPYISGTDRFLAVYTGQYPIFPHTSLMPIAWAAPPLLQVYGEAFKQSSIINDLDSLVIDFCTAQCDLIQLMESFSISLESAGAPATDVAVLPYFLYTRDRLYNEGTCLCVSYHESQTTLSSPAAGLSGENAESIAPSTASLSISRCVLLTAMIVEYAVAHNNYYTVKGPFLAAQVQSIIERQPNGTWDSDLNMRVWILFVLAVVVECWEGHLWVILQLRKSLSLKYKGQFPFHGWQNRELHDVKKFIWSTSAFDTLFWKVCCEVSRLQIW